MYRLPFFLIALFAIPSLAKDIPAILLPRNAHHTLTLAAKEIRRYVYLRTGVLCEILTAGRSLPHRPQLIALAPAGSGLLDLIPLGAACRDSLGRMHKDDYALNTVSTRGGKLLLITGYDDVATLYGAYAFAETLGVRFYADGDVIPEGTIPFLIPEVGEWHSPLFAIRGLQPFHDFPEGPDWWNEDDYRALFSQMAKMRMNFFGLHTYPEGGVGPEPTVWIGLKEDIRPGGEVAAGYPSRYFTTTGDPCWGYNSRKTGDYVFGFGELFEADSYGSDIMKGFSPHPRIGSGVPIPAEDMWAIQPRVIGPAQWNDLFSRSAGFYSSVFSFGRSLGIALCVGTETPLTIPTPVKARISELRKDIPDSLVREEVYAGMFERIKQTLPLDYYWFWTPEEWTWSGNNQQQVEATRRDLEAAQRAARKVQVPFSFATCGWVLGPKDDRSMFDTFLPKSWAVSCISREVGYEPVDPGFARISGRAKWAIPWLEDDPALTIPQLWVGRMRRDAADALAYGCTGLIGIHWRTRILSANISALAQAGWDQKGWNPRIGERLTSEEAQARSRQSERDLPANDFYLDWAGTQFGRNVAESAAMIFSRLDGLERYDKGRASAVNMPVPADWVNGPGGVKADSLTWDERKNEYAFVEEFESLRPSVNGAENLDRFDYWLATFKYLKAMGKFACSAGEINRRIGQARKDSAGDCTRYRQDFITLRSRQMEELEELHMYLLRCVRSNGELGTVANWQQHNMTFFVFMPGREIEKLLGEKLPDRCWPSRRNLVREMIIVPTVRTVLREGEDLRVKAILPSGTIESARLFWRSLAGKAFTSRDLSHIDRAVWEATLPGAEISGDLEYYIEVRTPGRTVRYPASAPTRNQTVVVY